MVQKLKEINCILCGSNNHKVLYPSTIEEESEKLSSVACTSDGHGEYYRIVNCKDCGFIFCSPRPTAEDIFNEYEDVIDLNYKQEVEGRVKTFNQNLDNIEKYIKQGKLLDIGCSLGVFLNEANKRGWQAEGIEPSQWCVEQADELFHLNLRQGTYHLLKNQDKKYDVVTLWDVIEHVADPKDLIKTVYSVLKKDGIVAISTMDVSSLYAKMMGKKWPWYMRMHLYYFSKRTMVRLLKERGFEIISIKKYHHIISYDYLLYKLEKVSKPLYYILSFIKKGFLIEKFYFNICFGDFMEVYARKL